MLCSATYAACSHAASKIFPAVCAALLLFFVTAAFAGASEEAKLDTVHVVSSPIIEGNALSRYGMESVTVSRSQMDDLNAQDITSALRRTPGVTISRFNPVGSFGGASGGGIFIRGSGSSRPGGELLMLYDGVPRYNPLFSHPLLDIISIDPAMAVTVHKSPQPQIYGNAHAAVDVQTKRMTEEGFTTTISGQYGSYNTVVQAAEHGGKKDQFDYYAAQSFKSSDGRRPHSSGQLQNYFARLGFQATDNWNIAWVGNHTDNFAHDPGDRRIRPRDNDGRYGTRDTFNTVTVANRHEKAEGWIKPYYTQGSARWRGETSASGGKMDTAFDWDMYGVRAKESFFPWKGGEIILGLDVDAMGARYENTSPAQWGRRQFVISSPYAAVSHQFGSGDGWRLTPSAGFRQYWHNEFDAEASPHAGLIIGYKDTELHFGYARSIVYPGLNAAIFSEVISPPIAAANPKGWKDLSAEVMDHYEVGLSQAFGTKVKAGMTAFRDKGRDRYQMYADPVTGMPAGFDNIGSYAKHGFESFITVALREDLRVFAGAAYVRTEPRTMPFAPRWTLSAGMNMRFLEKFQISVDGMYRSPMYTDSYSRGLADPAAKKERVNDAFLLNAKLSRFFEIPSLPVEKGEVFVAVENITNARYEYAPGYRMPGTSFMVGLSVTF